jgi:hypothetical protein
MKRLLFIAVLALSLIGSWRIAFAKDATNTPEARTNAFYTWFIEHDTDTSYPLNMAGIEQYVLPETVNRLRDDYSRAGPPGGVDYFLKVQDYDGHDWLSHIKTRPVVMLGDVAVVPVTFGSDGKVSVLVFMRKLDGLWKITKVDDTADYR